MLRLSRPTLRWAKQWLQDLPYTVVNTLFLLKTVNTLVKQPELYDRRTFTALLLVLLMSVGALVYKLTKLLKLPEMWREKKRLRTLKAEFEERERRLDAEAEAADAASIESDSELDSDGYVNGRSQSGDVPMVQRRTEVLRD